MNWKLLTVILSSLILLVICYLTIDFKKYFTTKKQIETTPSIKSTNYNLHKIKIDTPTEEEFKNLKIPEGHTAYYFYDECPSYKEEFYIIDLIEERLEKYHVPEKGYLLIVKKDHKWSKEPNFPYWVLDN